LRVLPGRAGLATDISGEQPSPYSLSSLKRRDSNEKRETTDHKKRKVVKAAKKIQI
jgi:hypothetical protein